MTSRRVIIVDDEPPARRRLVHLLADHPQLVVAGQAASVEEAAAMIERESPDLLLLDVQLSKGTSFALFDRVAVRCPVIFVTAHSQFALRAFEVNALDYVLKPLEPERLAVALARVDEPRAPSAALHESDLVSLRTSRGFRFVSLRDIVAICACDDYTEVVLSSGERSLCDQRMSDWGPRLGSAFVRVHRGWMVRLSLVDRFERRANGWELAVRGLDARVPVGRSWLDELRARLGVNALDS
ncbi:MAG: response regulator transcription factor [Myxococcales bacterium]|nr:response regulator transcription factor [Myxococcales bacterium]